MKEYIERTALEAELNKRLVDLRKEYVDYDAYANGFDEAVCRVEQFPAAADVVEVKRGRWKYFHKQNIAVCTNCSFERDLDANFGRAISCPNCGADMREVDHGNTV